MSTETNTPLDATQVQAARERYAAGLQRFVYRQMPEDRGLAQEILEKVWKNLPEQPGADVAGDLAGEWLFQQARRRVQAYLHGKGTAKKPEAEEEMNDESENAEFEEPHITMQRLIGRLTPKQQETLRLRFQNDFSVAAIARITELSAYNVGALVHNAMAKLARGFRAKHPTEKGTESKGVGDDARLSLYALGEMEDAERKSFEDSLIDKKTAALRADEIKAIAAVIGQTLAIEAGAPAPRTVRKRQRRGSAWWSFPRVLLPVAGVVVLAVAGYYFFRTPEAGPSSGPREKVDFKLKPADWKEPGAVVEEGSGRGGSAGNGDSDSPGSGTSGLSGSKRTGRTPAGQVSNRVTAGAIGKSSNGSREGSERSLPDGGAPDAVDGAAVQPEAVGRGKTGAVQGGVSATKRGKTGDSHGTVAAEPSGLLGERTLSDGEAHQDPTESRTDTSPMKAARTTSAKGGKSGAKSSIATNPAAPGSGRMAKEFTAPSVAAASRLAPDGPVTTVTKLKQALRTGRLPPEGAVKVEQLLNYFQPKMEAPKGGGALAVAIEATEAPWDPARRLVRVSVKGRERPLPPRGEACVILLLDVSGSMEAANRLPLVKEAGRLLLARLRPQDRVGLVTYAAEPKLALPPTPVAALPEILQVLEGLAAQGPTNGGAGLELAYALAREHAVPGGRNCVIMCTDGDFNAGPTREEELARIVDRQLDSGVTLSIYGFGRGRQIDARLETLAKRGGGESGYVNTRREAEQVLAGEVNGLISPVAQDVSVEVVFNPEQVTGYRLLGYDEPAVGRAGDKVAAAAPLRTMLPGQTFTALYEVVPNEGAHADEDMLTVQLDYVTPADGVKRNQVQAGRDRRLRFTQAGVDFKFAAAVGVFGLVLNGQAPAGMSLGQVEAWAEETLGQDEGGYRSEFMALVREARSARPE